MTTPTDAGKKKIFVLDTNVLLHNPGAIEAFSDNDVYLPMTVIEELDKVKKYKDREDLKRSAREVSRFLNNKRKGVKFGDPIPLSGGGNLFILINHHEDISKVMDEYKLKKDVNDNWILATSRYLQNSNPDREVIFITQDINAGLKAWSLGIKDDDFDDLGRKPDSRTDNLYTGYREIQAPSQFINELYSHKYAILPNYEGSEDLRKNEFVILESLENSKHGGIGVVESDRTIRVVPENKKKIFSIMPKNTQQKMATNLLLDPDISLVTLVGEAGTGKTLLALAVAFELVFKQKELGMIRGTEGLLGDEPKFEKLYVSRPLIPMGKDFGFLPGDKDEKLSHWMQPILDNIEFLIELYNKNVKDKKDEFNKSIMDLIKKEGKLVFEPLQYIRGRTIRNSIILIDEAQNLTPHEIKTIATRIGEGSKMIFTGDPNQIDNPYLTSYSNGLTLLIEWLCRDESIVGEIGHITLKNNMRSSFARKLTRSLKNFG
ncbi:PhoH family protein [Patescibacteria group bacterium]